MTSGRRRGRGEGSIYKRADGRWTGQMDLGLVDGKRKRKTVYAGTAADVRDKMRAVHARQRAGMPVTDDRRPLNDFPTEWLDHVVLPSVRPRTHESYASIVTNHLRPNIGTVPIGRLSASQAQGLLAKKLAEGLSPKTVEYIWQVLRRALNVAVSWGLVGQNVAVQTSPPRPTSKEVHVLSVEDLKLLLQQAPRDRLEAGFVLAITCGLRRGEVLGLRWEDVEIDQAPFTLRVRRSLQRRGGQLLDGEPKSTKSRRTIALPTLAVDALKRHRSLQNKDRLKVGNAWNGTGFAFLTGDGNRIDPRYFLRRWHRLLEASGLPRAPLHDARHGAASLMLSQGVPLKVVQETLGHSTIRLTADLYGHLMPGDAEKAAVAVDSALA